MRREPWKIARSGVELAVAALLSLASTPPKARPVSPAETSSLEKRFARRPPPSDLWQPEKYAWAALPPWARGCPAVQRALECPEDVTPEARVLAGGLVIGCYSSGAGLWAIYESAEWAFRREACDGVALRVNGSIAEPFEFISGLPDDPSGVARIHGWELARPADPRHAGARAALTPAVDGAPLEETTLDEGPVLHVSVSASVSAPQPEHRGRPQPIRETLWTAAQLRAGGMRTTEFRHTERFTADGLLVREAAPPTPVASCGDHVVYVALWRMRRGGGVVAVYDRARDTHRWVFGTPFDDDGGRIDYDDAVAWRCATDGVAVAGDMLLDLERATLHGVSGPSHSTGQLTPTAEGWELRYLDDEFVRYTGTSGRVIPWREVRAALGRVAASPRPLTSPAEPPPARPRPRRRRSAS